MPNTIFNVNPALFAIQSNSIVPNATDTYNVGSATAEYLNIYAKNEVINNISTSSVTVTGTQDSSSTSTGSIVTAGGLGVAKTINANAIVATTATISAGGISFTGNAALSGPSGYLFQVSGPGPGTATTTLVASTANATASTIVQRDGSGNSSFNAIQAGSVLSSQSGTTYTLALGDANTIIQFTNAAAVAVTIPTNASVAFPVGTNIVFVQTTAAGKVTLSGAGTTLNASSGFLSTAIQWSEMIAIKTATDTWLISGERGV